MLVSSLGLAAISCNVEIKDAEWFVDIGPLGAHSFHTLSEKESDLTKEQWDAKRMGMFCTNSDNLAEIVKLQLKLCNRTRACKKEVVEILNGAMKKIEENEN